MQRWGRKIQIRALFEFLFSRFIRFLFEVFSDEGSLTFLDFYNFSRCNRDSSDKSKYHLFINHQMCQGYAIFLVWVATYMCFVCMCVGNVSICMCLDTAIYVQSIHYKDAILCVLAAQYVWICLQFVCNIRQGGAICARSASSRCKREWAWWDNGESRWPPTKVVPPSSSSSASASASSVTSSSWSYSPSSSSSSCQPRRSYICHHHLHDRHHCHHH